MGINDRNDCSDAFRHCFFNALNARSCGSVKAKLFGDAHECDVPLELLSEKEMDLHNNEIGVEIGIQYMFNSNIEIANIICSRLANGDLIILEDPMVGSSNLIDSDSCECL